MKITSDKFHQENEILFSASIVKARGWSAEQARRDHDVGIVDVIDMNQNKISDLKKEKGGILRDKVMYVDPALDVSIEKLTEFADANETEIITEELYGELNILDSGVSMGVWMVQKMDEIQENKRSIGQLVKETLPDEPDTKWAIDILKKEFIIFR